MLGRSFMPLRFICVVVVAFRASYRRSGRNDGGFQRYGSVKAVAPAQHSLDQSAVRIAELIAQQCDALHKRIVGHKNVGPHRFDKLIFGNKSPCILGKIAQHFECLWRQSDLLVSVSQTSAPQIERKTIETEHSRRKRTHPLRLPRLHPFVETSVSHRPAIRTLTAPPRYLSILVKLLCHRGKTMNRIDEEQRWHSDWRPLRLLK